MMPQVARHLLESTAFAMIVALLPGLMRKRGAAARHTIWLIAALKFAVPAALFSTAGAHLCALFPTRPSLFVALPVFASFVATPGVTASNAGSLREVWVAITLIWLVGIGGLLTVWTRRLLTPVGALAPVLDTDREALVRLGRRIGLRRAVDLRYSKAKIEPGLCGIWRPTITISQGLRGQLTPAELEAVLLHELAHAKRADNLSTALVHTLVCVFWFHPLLWWIERQLLRERELACDEVVVRHSSAPEEYVTGILKVCRFHIGDTASAACGITGSGLKKRLEAIMSFQSSNPAPRAPRFFVGALVSIMTVVPLTGGFLSSSIPFGQTESGGKPSTGSDGSKTHLSCVYRDISFPEGTLIYVTGSTGTQMCVSGSRGGRWDWSKDPERKRRRDIIVLPPEKPLPPCEIKASPSADLCACQTGVFSKGSLVESADGKGKLYCDKGQWHPATRHEQGLE
jgi:bla regulator protein blaR1